jgi:hypothetical protein
VSIISLAEVEIIENTRHIPLIYSVCSDYGVPVAEPFFDYDEEGEPQDFGIDLEPEGPNLEDLESVDLSQFIYDVSPSQFTETAIRVPTVGKVDPFSFVGREYLRRIYDTPAQRLLLKAGRQIEKSTSLGNKLLCYACLNSNFKCLFVAPSAEQSKVFSNDRIKDIIENSPMLAAYTNTKMNQNVFFKKLINFSQIRLRYAYLNADRVRGIPADLVLVDEIQDILIDNIPVIEQCAFHSPYKLFVYSGTPKSLDNTIEHYWSNFSTQNEWVVPCERHGTPKNSSTWHWNILTESNIGKEGLVCDKCGESISASHPMAMWAAMNPIMEDNKDKVTFEGYRIPQIMVPWVDWKEVLQHQEQYSRAQFHNEKLGLSYDSGVRPLTRGQLKRCCKPEIRLGDIEHFKRLSQGNQIYCGIDWGSGENTYTVISFGGYFGTGNFSVFWIHRFTGQDLDPERQLDTICQMIAQLNVQLVGTDYGGGFYPNDRLTRVFGPQKIMKYQYNPKQKKKIYWEQTLGRFMCHRTEVMSDMFGAIKRKLIDLPNWDDFRDPYGKDCLNIFSEFNDRLRIIEYKKKPGTTDDAFHSMLYCFFVSMLQHPRPDITARQKDSGLPRGQS